ncbi:MAG TPA: PAS domain-containing sensor histidine kinase [bacterium]|nr:PAS domain-containing sensor histidine kinase [bacterium]HPN42432.1 PAS domain-containing sensor histidine kinase [bacterium]
MHEKPDDKINDLKQQIGELQALNKLQSEIINALPYFLIVIDDDYNIISCNSVVKDLLQESPVGLNIFSTIPVYDHPDMHQFIQSAIQSAPGSRKTQKIKNNAQNSDWIQYDAVRLSANAGINATLIVSKILSDTENLGMDAMLVDKFISLSSFSGKVAHDINNPLSVIITRTDFLQHQNLLEEIEDGVIDIKEEVTLLQKQAARIYGIIEKISALQIHTKEEPATVDMTEIVSRAVMVAEFQRPHKTVHAEKEFAENLPPTRCIEIRLERAIGEIVKNAFEAAGEHGMVTIKLEYDPQKNGCYIFKVQDNGPGIARENLGRVFDPFFTTKEGIKGAGLGLTIAYAAALSHQGKIHVESQVGEGTVVTLLIPRSIP